MARLQQTQRKRVESVPRLPVDVVAAIAAEVEVQIEAEGQTGIRGLHAPSSNALQLLPRQFLLKSEKWDGSIPASGQVYI
ncbi:hypothetical protein AgCh_010452 [Apium graveolens]